MYRVVTVVVVMILVMVVVMAAIRRLAVCGIGGGWDR